MQQVDGAILEVCVRLARRDLDQLRKVPIERIMMSSKICQTQQVAGFAVTIRPVANSKTASAQPQLPDSLRIGAEKRPFTHAEFDQNPGGKNIYQKHCERHMCEFGRRGQP
jgi:hypothetical protein